MSSMQGDYWQFEAKDSGQVQILIAILKNLSLKDLEFWRERIIEHLDHYIQTISSEVREEKKL